MLRSSRAHLAEVGESYLQHLRAALRYAGLLTSAGAACALHALIPGLCRRSGSRCVARLHAELVARGVITRAR